MNTATYIVYMYNTDTGLCVGATHNIEPHMWKALATQLNSQGYDIKIVDKSTGDVIYTLG